jgi:Cu(I)/Ag(I) efflux system membrane fusion protein
MSDSRENFIGLVMTGAAILAAASAGAGYWFARRGQESVSLKVSTSSMQSRSTVAASGAQPLYWYDPMVPTQHFDKPGKSPFMEMELIPKYAESGTDEASIKIDPTIVQNLGVRLAVVERGPFLRPLEAVGSIVFNERNIAVIQARTSGFVTRVYARAPGDVLAANAALVDLLVPEWAGAQSEFLVLHNSGDRELVDAARQRLVLLGMSDELIARLEVSGQPHTTITIRTPLAGVIETLDVRAGMSVAVGATLAKITGLATVWLEAAMPEAQAAQVAVGRLVEVRLSAYPGEAFKGHVIAVLPEANLETRTLRVRIELANHEGRLRPGMFAQVRLESGNPAPVLSVASEAVIHTGTRTVVIVAGDAGRFIPTEVQTGAEADGKTVILKGLAEGQKVVASGQFLIDSEASLSGVLARLGGNPQPDSDK